MGAARGGEAGDDLLDDAVVVLPGARDTEVRTLSVLFCDFVGSSALSARMDAEDFGDLMRRFHETVHRAVTPFGGFVAQLMGDGQLVVFGYPDAHDDDPAQAVRAGLAILAAIERLGSEVQVRIGIHTGSCAVRTIGAGGRQDTLVVGETANLAARVQTVAEPGTVCITGVTERLVVGWFDTAPMGSFDLKGFDHPVAVSRVVDTTGARSRFDARTARGLSPMVGRDTQLATLRACWRRAVDGLGGIVVIEGDAGIGKSRLVRALRDDIADEPHRWIEGNCTDVRRNTSFHPIVEAVESLLGFHAALDDEERRHRLEAGLTALGLGQPEPVGLLSALLELDHPAESSVAHLSAEGRRNKTVDGLIAWLSRLAMVEPVVLCIEDLHWADPSTQELLDRLAPAAASAAVLVVLTLRTGNTASWSERPEATVVGIDAVGPDDAVALVRAVAGDHATGRPAERMAAALDRIVERGEGNPLFLEELARAALDDITVGAVDETIPHSLNGLVVARLDGLGAAKAVAQAASVLGRTFVTDTVVDLLGDGAGDGDADRAVVERTVRAALIDLERSGLSHASVPTPPDAHAPAYRFKHALVHEATYHSMLRATRRQLHERVVRHAERRLPDAVATEPEVYARHAELGALPSEAITLYRAAAARSAATSAWSENLAHLEQALAVLSDSASAVEPIDEPGRIEVELRQAMAVTTIRAHGYAHPDTLAAWERARQCAERHAHGDGLGAALLGLGTGEYVAAHFDVATEHMAAVLSLEGPDATSALAVAAHTVNANIAFFEGRFRDSLAHIARSLAIYEPHRHHRELISILADDSGVTALAMSGWALYWLGELDAAMDAVDRAVEMANRLGDPYTIAQAVMWRTLLAVERNDPGVEEDAEALLRFTEDQHIPAFAAGAQMYLGRIRRDPELILAAAARGGTAGTMIMAPAALLGLALAYRDGGALDQAIEMADAGIAIADATRQHSTDVQLRSVKADVLIARASERPDERDVLLAEAEALGRHSLAQAVEQSAKTSAVIAATSIAKVLRQLGREDEAAELLRVHLEPFTGAEAVEIVADARALLAIVGADPTTTQE